MTFDNGREDTGDVAMRFNLVQFAGFNQRRYDGSMLRAGVITCKECILALKGDGADRSFDGVTNHHDPAIVQEQDQAIPVLRDVFECHACGDLAET